MRLAQGSPTTRQSLNPLFGSFKIAKIIGLDKRAQYKWVSRTTIGLVLVFPESRRDDLYLQTRYARIVPSLYFLGRIIYDGSTSRCRNNPVPQGQFLPQTKTKMPMIAGVGLP